MSCWTTLVYSNQIISKDEKSFNMFICDSYPFVDDLVWNIRSKLMNVSERYI